MSKYIDRDRFTELLLCRDLRTINTKTVGECLDKAEADVVKVVRCKDCKYRKKLPNVSYGECIYSASMVSDNDYCSNGER